jgi:hypothetical protein
MPHREPQPRAASRVRPDGLRSAKSGSRSGGRDGDTKTPRPVDGASVGDATVASDRSYRGEARECERHNGEDAHERVEARAGRSHTNLQSGNPADSGGGRPRNPSPVALRPRVTPGLPFSADPSRAGTALAVCQDPTPWGCACAPSNPSHRRAVPWSGGPHGTPRRYGRWAGRPSSDVTGTRTGRRAAATVGRGGWIASRAAARAASRAAYQRAMRPPSGRRGRKFA